MMNRVSGGGSVKSRALASSAVLLAVLAAAPAHAECAPDPVAPNG